MMLINLFLLLVLNISDPTLDLVLIESSDETFEIVNSGLAIHSIEESYIVTSEEGLRKVDLVQYYNKFVSVEKFDVIIESLEGKRLKRFKPRDLSDYSATSSFSLYEDNRLKAMEFSWNEFPVRIKITKKIEYTSSLLWPDWLPQKHVPTLKSTFTLKSNSDDDFQFYEHVLDSVDHVVIRDKGVMHTWVSNFQPAFERSSWSSRSYSSLPRLLISPKRFKIDGYEGEMDTWENFGKWFFKLNDNRQQLPADVKKEVSSIVSNTMSDEEKIETLYRYLQKQTRYVSVQLGIGGFQTFDAEYVARNKYGDCKALSNYMISMLNHVNIPAYAVLIKGEEYFDDIVTKFPSNQFNHVIVAVPTAKDTVWLECTSSLNPPGFLGSFTAGRHGLMISEKGGELVKTPSLSQKDNQRVDTLHIYVTNKNTAKVTATMYRSGFSSQNYSNMAFNASERDLKKFVRRQFNFTSIDISSVKIERHPDSALAVLSFEGTIPKVGKPVGPHMLVTPLMFEGGFSIPDTTKERVEPIIMDYAETIKTTVFYHFDKSITNITDEFTTSEATPFSSTSFRANFEDEKTLKAEYSLIFETKKIEAEHFNTFVKFLREANKNFEYTTLLKF